MKEKENKFFFYLIILEIIIIHKYLDQQIRSLVESLRKGKCPSQVVTVELMARRCYFVKQGNLLSLTPFSLGIFTFRDAPSTEKKCAKTFYFHFMEFPIFYFDTLFSTQIFNFLRNYRIFHSDFPFRLKKHNSIVMKT